MSRLLQQIVGKTKSLNINIFKRFKFNEHLFSPITTLKSKFNSLSLQLPSIELPLIKHKQTDNKSKHNKHQNEHKNYDNAKTSNKYRHKYMHMAYIALGSYISIEILFYFRCKYLEYYANNYISVNIVQPNISHQRCEYLLDLALKYAGLYNDGYEGWLKLWFNECNIKHLKRDNILELFYWGFFVENYKPYNDINDKYNNELKWRDEFVRKSLIKLETQMNYKFPQGYNDKIMDRFNNKRDIELHHHSFLLYFIVSLIQIYSHLLMKYSLGFKYEWINDMKVWYKNTNNSRKDKNVNALLFLHGIGIGLAPYYYFLKTLLNKNKEMDMLYMIEIPYITMNILHLLPFSKYSHITNRLPMQISDYIHILNIIEKKHNDLYYNWNILGHSYGSMIASNIYLQQKENNKPRLILVDPACFCLSHPSTVAAFVTNIDDIIENDQWMNGKINLRKLLAKELMISCNLRKYFHWYDLVLYPEQLIDGKKHVIITCEKDNFIPLELIEKGIQNVNNDEKYDVIIHHTINDTGHGEWVWDQKSIEKVVSAL